MRSELDRRYDEMLAKVTGPGGPLVLERDAQGRAIVSNFPSTLPAFFRTFCAVNAGKEALVAGDERLSFADLDRISERLAQGLVAKGVGKGDRIGIAMRNCPTWIVAYMAISKAGGLATLLNGWWQPHEMEHAVGLAEPKLILADEQRASRIAERCGKVDVFDLAIDRDIEEAVAPLVGTGNTSAALPAVSADDDATILFTSGSTGACKGAVSTHRAVTAATYAYATGLIVLRGLLEEDARAPLTQPRTLLSVPLFHVTGEVPVMLNSFVIGRCMVVMPKWDAAEALRLIQKERITYFVGVPTMSLELLNHPERDRFDISSLKDITGGGAPRPVAHVERLRREIPTAQPALGYGLTETNAVGCSNFWSNYAAKPASTGRPQRPYVEIGILDDDGGLLGAGQTGEIGIRSAANVRGYWRDPDATSGLFTAGGYVRTGDIGFLDDDGYLFIVDRKKDIIIRGGENISAAELEAALYGCNAVAEAAVFGIPDVRLGEVPMAVVALKEGEQMDEVALSAFLQGRLARFKLPAAIQISRTPLPRLGTGKFDRPQLKAQYRR